MRFGSLSVRLATTLAALALAGAVHAVEITVYSAGPGNLAQSLARGFTAEEGIKVNLFQATAGQIMARYMAEKANPQVDVMISASWAHAADLASSGELMAYASPNAAKVPAALKSAHYVAQGAAALSIVWNPKSGKPRPTDWFDLAKPEYKELVTMPDPAQSGSALALISGLIAADGDRNWALFAALKKNGMVVPGPNNAALNPVLQGAKAAVIGAVDYISLGQIQKGEAIEVIYPRSGTVLEPRPVMILRSARNPDGAKRFVDYVLSEDGQRMVASVFLLPARTDIAAKRPGWNEIRIIEYDQGQANRDAIAIKDRFKTLMAK